MDHLDLNITNHLPKITKSYLDKEIKLRSFYNRHSSIENFKEQIIEKKNNYNDDFRAILNEFLTKEYYLIKNKSAQIKQINCLKNKNTFTVTTGHQLNLFTGPLYFLYKIIDTIKICNELKKKFPNNKFVPIYWMASEDHDFEEINFFKTLNKKFHWNINCSGKVGQLKTDSLKELLEEIKLFFGDESLNSKKIIDLFQNSYLKHKNLSMATFQLVNELFGCHGLLILNTDSKKFKEILVDDFIDEIKHQTCYNEVIKSNTKLNELEYKPQVNPRKINLFYCDKKSRDRIINNGKEFKIDNKNLIFSEDEIIEEVKKSPEKFSPNVLIRTVFQEKLLPNLAYVGGGSEIAYWLQLKNYFKKRKITFPILKIRTSVLIVKTKKIKICKKLGISISDLFQDYNQLSNYYIKKISKNSFDLSKMKNVLNHNFDELFEISKKIDKSFLGALKAQQKKQIKGLENLEKRLIKAEKISKKDKLVSLKKIQDELFPNKNLQEREINFSEFFKDYGDEFLNLIYDNIDPFNNKLTLITI